MSNNIFSSEPPQGQPSDRSTSSGLGAVPQHQTHGTTSMDAHETMLCCGDGRFLRAFACWAVDQARRSGRPVGRVVCCTNTPNGSVASLNAAGGSFSVVLRGLREGHMVEELTTVYAISRGIDTFRDWPALLAVAASPDLDVIISNTTEAGIVWCDESRPVDRSPASFPARLTALLHHRWGARRSAPLILPCELVVGNAPLLASLVERHAIAWNLEPAFLAWCRDEVHWCETLVDRIVPGIPADADALRSYHGLASDHAIIAAEPYLLWAVRGGATEAARLPLEAITWVSDLAPLRERKVRVLNGAHLALSLLGLLSGISTVRSAQSDAGLGPWLHRFLERSVLPGLVRDSGCTLAEATAYAAGVAERFANPAVEHRLADIALNAVAKWRARILPTLLAEPSAREDAALILAALLVHHRDPAARDDAAALAALARHRNDDSGVEASAVCADVSLWGRDLTQIPGFAHALGVVLTTLRSRGVRAALAPSTLLLRIHDDDTVAVALEPVSIGTTLPGGGRARQDIPAGHKVALRNHTIGEPVLKYGWPIGTASAVINVGDHIHVHNLRTALSSLADIPYRPLPANPVTPLRGTWRGYRRADGRCGTRNELWIVPTVGCVAKTAEALATAFRLRLAEFPGIDSVQAFAHPYGCSQLGDDLARTQVVLAALADHPNAGGVLVLGLGCENNHLGVFRPLLTRPGSRLRVLATQKCGDEHAVGLELLAELATVASQDRREELSLTELTVGLKCGGSDGLSGITANPMVGRFAARLAAAGGRAVLTEVPEMFGAEPALFSRCADRSVFNAAVDLVQGFRKFYADRGQPVSENPSPGNKDGGISTLEEKSLGCVQKGGGAVITDVVKYGRRVATQGLSLLEAPGNDQVSTTALAAAGCGLVLFTTGRGTPLGCPVPTVKISTNSDLAQRKPGWIDVDAGPLATGADRDAIDAAFADQVLRHASGEPTRNERNGQRDLAIFKDGVTL